MSTFTTGEARQRDLRPIRTQVATAEPTEPGWDALIEQLAAVNALHDAAGRENPILRVFRAYTFAGDSELLLFAGWFLEALDTDNPTGATRDIHADIRRELDPARTRVTGRIDANSTIAAYREHATRVLTRIAATAAA